MQDRIQKEIFDYRTLRLIIGLIAFLLPIIVSLVASQTLPSISASYYTSARDKFVGMLFIVGSFLFAYNGHSKFQSIASKIASVAAIGVAIFPTNCQDCETDLNAMLHSVSAALLFFILAYFCIGPFRNRIKDRGGKKGLRSKIYLLCGITMLLCIGAISMSINLLPAAVVNDLRIIYWGEAVALSAFGVAWFVSGKALRVIAEEEEMLKLF